MDSSAKEPRRYRSTSSLVELTKGRVREFMREPSAFFFVIFMPIVWMVLLGFGLSGERRPVYGVGWNANQTATELSAAVHKALSEHPSIRLVEGDQPELDRALLRGHIVMTVEIAELGAVYRFDATNPDSRQAREQVDEIVQTTAGRRDPVSVSEAKITIPGTRYIDFLTPGLLALTILSSSLWGTGMTIVSNRRENLLKRYLATPMRPSAYILSHIFGRGVILAFEMATILIAGALIFDFHVAGSLLAFIAVATLGAASLTALGIMCGSRTTNVAAMNGACNLVMLPMMIFSGVWFSRSNLPEWLAEATRWLPLTALVDGLRRIALEGATLANLTFEIAVMIGYFLVCAVAAKSMFKWY